MLWFVPAPSRFPPPEVLHLVIVFAALACSRGTWAVTCVFASPAATGLIAPYGFCRGCLGCRTVILYLRSAIND